MENQINFIQIQKDNEEHLKIASSLWVPFICEVNDHDGTYEDEEQIIEGLKKRIAIQGSRKDMHFEIAMVNGEPFGIAMLLLTLGLFMVYWKKVMEQLWDFIFVRIFVAKGWGLY